MPGVVPAAQAVAGGQQHEVRAGLEHRSGGGREPGVLADRLHAQGGGVQHAGAAALEGGDLVLGAAVRGHAHHPAGQGQVLSSHGR